MNIRLVTRSSVDMFDHPDTTFDIDDGVLTIFDGFTREHLVFADGNWCRLTYHDGED